MGRPRPTNLNRDFVVLFADAVTVTSAHPFDWIARNGEHCIFNLLLLLAPKVIAHQDAAFVLFDLTYLLRPCTHVHTGDATRAIYKQYSAREVMRPPITIAYFCA